MAYKGPIQLIREFESERDEIIFHTRENFAYVYKNGGTKDYSIEKLSALAKEKVPELKWGKSTFQHFLEGRLNFSQQSLPPIIKLLELSIKLRDEVEPHVQAARKLIEESKRKWSKISREPSP